MGTTGLVAILFTDVVGSTEAVARLGEERAEQLRQTHFALLREGISDHAGTEVKNLGDGLMVAFGAASDAVACAVAMQQAVGRHNRRRWSRPWPRRARPLWCGRSRALQAGSPSSTR